MLGAKLAAEAYLQRLNAEISRINLADLQRWSDLLYHAWEQDRFVYIIGNGGSGTTASHMAEDLGKSTLKPEDLKDESKKRLKVLSLTDNAGWIMAVGNDVNQADDYGIMQVDYAPNALGQPTKAGTWAQDVSYHPNGAVKQFTQVSDLADAKS